MIGGLRFVALLGSAYAAILPGGTQAQEWVARHDLSAAAYQNEFNRLIGQGFRPKLVSGYTGGGGGPHFAAIWEKRGGPEFVARHGLTSEAYQAEFNRLVSQGFRLTYASGYDVGGRAHFAAIWEKRGGPEFVARHGLTSGAYQGEFDRLVSQGFRLTLVNGYGFAGTHRFAAIWEK
ncbi:MAG: hypothetical protein ACREC6_11485 [Hyphomicrobiaceae bacterium]